VSDETGFVVVLFDMNGFLLDTETFATKATLNVAQACGSLSPIRCAEVLCIS
jgi:beta-phosphoglucomutase-like phosphatase (HAD superfamily)